MEWRSAERKGGYLQALNDATTLVRFGRDEDDVFLCRKERVRVTKRRNESWARLRGHDEKSYLNDGRNDGGCGQHCPTGCGKGRPNEDSQRMTCAKNNALGT